MINLFHVSDSFVFQIVSIFLAAKLWLHTNIIKCQPETRSSLEHNHEPEESAIRGEPELHSDLQQRPQPGSNIS